MCWKRDAGCKANAATDCMLVCAASATVCLPVRVLIRGIPSKPIIHRDFAAAAPCYRCHRLHLQRGTEREEERQIYRDRDCMTDRNIDMNIYNYREKTCARIARFQLVCVCVRAKPNETLASARTGVSYPRRLCPCVMVFGTGFSRVRACVRTCVRTCVRA